MKVSVIIAAYNAEKYLVETLQSVVNQTLDDYEIITINDGSKDGTLDILKEYEKEYPNFTVISKENGGVSAARNDGLNVAQGKYVYFYDADDILELEALEKMYEAAENNKAELVIAGYDMFDQYKTTEVKELNSLLELEKIDKYDTDILKTFSLTNKLFRRDIIEKYNLRLPPISYSEDGVFSMNYVYHVTKITGLEMVVTHYRRMIGDTNAATQNISDSKVEDYIEAHRLILQAARDSILRDFPKYKSINQVRAEDKELTEYLNRIIYKELNILIKQFYSKFWSLKKSTIEKIKDEILEKIEILDLQNASLVADENPDISLYNIITDEEEMKENAHFTAVLYGKENDEEQFIKCLDSLANQNLVGVNIVLPESMKKIVEDNDCFQKNMIFIEAQSEEELFRKALETTKTRYITFCDSKILYSNNTFKYVFKRFIKTHKDFLIELIYHTNFNEPQPVYLNRIAQESVMNEVGYNDNLCMDYTLANKFFDVHFVREIITDKKGIKEHIEDFYKKGCYTFFNDGIVHFDGKEREFISFIEHDGSTEYIKKYFEDAQVDLNSEDLAMNPGEALVKLQDISNFKEKTFVNNVIKFAIERYKTKEVINRTLFISVRKNGELEGNAKALYPYVKGDKVIFAKQLPHNPLQILKAVKLICTSKVIVTDDYVKYLRYFDLKPEQRVIQLWHACGAFKKFGQRGTNLEIRTDLATHAQYNLVSVSGAEVRPIYADAFDIDLKKVKALGVPRTDEFFDKKLIEQKREAIYKAYPELKGKFVIIYAPTFRDEGEGRSQFNPKIDFDRLSEKLLPNQQFIICPHPVMKNDIVPKKYDNIKVVRDFSTNDFMFVSDMLITDYSSVIFEYALLKKPIGFFCYDLAIYDRGFYLNYPDDLPGEVYENQEQLEEFLQDSENTKLTEKYDTFIKKYMSGCDGHSCERLAGLINSYVGRK